jgi:hypothetical protein
MISSYYLLASGSEVRLHILFMLVNPGNLEAFMSSLFLLFLYSQLEYSSYSNTL